MTSFLSRECDDADLQFGRERKGHKIRLGREGGSIGSRMPGAPKVRTDRAQCQFWIRTDKTNQEESQDSVE